MSAGQAITRKNTCLIKITFKNKHSFVRNQIAQLINLKEDEMLFNTVKLPSMPKCCFDCNLFSYLNLILFIY